jgi:hypothetical protein
MDMHPVVDTHADSTPEHFSGIFVSHGYRVDAGCAVSFSQLKRDLDRVFIIAVHSPGGTRPIDVSGGLRKGVREKYVFLIRDPFYADENSHFGQLATDLHGRLPIKTVKKDFTTKWHEKHEVSKNT